MKYIRSRALLDAAQNMSCVHCGRKIDGVTVAAHYQGIRAEQYGKGKSIKPHDLCAADLCDECHRKMDQYTDGNLTYAKKIDMSEEFLHCIMLTLIRRVEQGIITIKGYKP